MWREDRAISSGGHSRGSGNPVFAFLDPRLHGDDGVKRIFHD